MKQYKIPRNLNIREVLAYGLTGKQLLYIGIGVGGAVASFASPLPVIIKFAGVSYSICTGLWVAVGKIHGQDVDRYMGNSIQYAARGKDYENDTEKKEETVQIRLRTARHHST